jgi:hypothetical protein
MNLGFAELEQCPGDESIEDDVICRFKAPKAAQGEQFRIAWTGANE